MVFVKSIGFRPFGECPDFFVTTPESEISGSGYLVTKGLGEADAIVQVQQFFGKDFRLISNVLISEDFSAGTEFYVGPAYSVEAELESAFIYGGGDVNVSVVVFDPLGNPLADAAGTAIFSVSANGEVLPIVIDITETKVLYTVNVAAGEDLAVSKPMISVLAGEAMEAIRVTAPDGCIIPEDYTHAPVNGVSVERVSGREIAAYGEPVYYGNTASSVEITAISVDIQAAGYDQVTVPIRNIFSIDNSTIIFTVVIVGFSKTADWDVTLKPTVSCTDGSCSPEPVSVRINYDLLTN